MPNRQTVQGVRTGGRSARVRKAILDATLGELIDRGYADLTVEAVASRAGVNKTTIYRRWSTLEDLLVETLTTWSLDAIPIPETGSIESDLLATGRELATVLNDGVGRQVAALVLTAGLRSNSSARQPGDTSTTRPCAPLQSSDRPLIAANSRRNAMSTRSSPRFAHRSSTA